MTRNPDNMYNKILEHSECVLELDAFYYNSSEVNDISAIQIANYGNGDNLSIECIKCNDVIISIDKPIEEETQRAEREATTARLNQLGGG